MKCHTVPKRRASRAITGSGLRGTDPMLGSALGRQSGRTSGHEKGSRGPTAREN